MRTTRSRGILAAILVLAATGPLAAQQKMALAPTGSFSGGPGHPASGTFTITGSGKDRKLELSDNFEVSDAADIRVLLARDAMAKGDGALDLGTLKKAGGAQSFRIPESANLAAYTAVLLWSTKDDAILGHAPLGGSMDHGAMDHGSMMKPMAKDTGMMQSMAKDSMMKKP